MGSRISTVVAKAGAIIRDTLGALGGDGPEGRSSDGADGTHQMNSRRLDDARRAKYPRD